jgi:hypothetical protein
VKVDHGVGWEFLQPLRADVERRREDRQHADMSSICQDKHTKPDEHKPVFVLCRQKLLTANVKTLDHDVQGYF